jgi:hypothetical protein
MVIRSRRSFIPLQEKVKIVAQALKRARTERRRIDDMELLKGYTFDIIADDISRHVSHVVQMAHMSMEVLAQVKDVLRLEVIDGSVTIIDFSLEMLDNDVSGWYSEVDLLPDWVKDRLALLMMVDPTPPTKYVDGVGRRISETVFWIEQL